MFFSRTRFARHHASYQKSLSHHATSFACIIAVFKHDDNLRHCSLSKAQNQRELYSPATKLRSKNAHHSSRLIPTRVTKPARVAKLARGARLARALLWFDLFQKRNKEEREITVARKLRSKNVRHSSGSFSHSSGETGSSGKIGLGARLARAGCRSEWPSLFSHCTNSHPIAL